MNQSLRSNKVAFTGLLFVFVQTNVSLAFLLSGGLFGFPKREVKLVFTIVLAAIAAFIFRCVSCELGMVQ
jgi:hypothetical protein